MVLNLYKYLKIVKKISMLKKQKIVLTKHGKFLFVILALTISTTILVAPLVTTCNNSELIKFTPLLLANNMIFFEFASYFRNINIDATSMNFEKVNARNLFKRT